MKTKRNSQGLVVDVGASEGNDTAFYLAKGFQVIAVEADPIVTRHLRVRFRPWIRSGKLLLLNFVASATFGDVVEFLVHSEFQGISSIYRRPDVDPTKYSKHAIMTIDWRTICAQAGKPRYVKIDIERHEERFLRGMMRTQEFPEFISIEAYELRPCEMLWEMGYERFKLVDQNPPAGFQLPAKQLEGLHVDSADFTHGSGPFGLDIFQNGDWLDFKAFRTMWHESVSKVATTWFDCHAWRPN